MSPCTRLALVIIAAASLEPAALFANESLIPAVDRMMGPPEAEAAAMPAPLARHARRSEADLRDGLAPARYALWLRAELGSPEWERRRNAAVRAGQPGRVEAVSSLGAAVVAPMEDPRVRAAAAAGLGGIRHPSGVPFLSQALAHDPEWRVRLESARALGAIGDRQSVAPLSHALYDPDAGVRVAAGVALGRIGGNEAIRHLREALHDETDPLQAGILAGALRTARP